jgi:hypothetical protein
MPSRCQICGGELETLVDFGPQPVCNRYLSSPGASEYLHPLILSQCPRDGVRPILSPHFNITVELPLKAIIRGFSFTTIPITWRNRRTGTAKLKIKEMGSRYLFICLYVWLEKYFSRGDYRKTTH